jgi:Protein of unknown function (DUF2612)
MTTRIQPFDFSVDLLRAILWQYNDAARLQSILQQKNDWYATNQADFWSNWVTDVFDLKTANDFGLSVWALILNLPLSVIAPGTGARVVFGFGINNSNFNNSNFGRDGDSVISLTTEQRRLLLRLRWFQLISDGTIPHINFALRDVFGPNFGYVLDHYDMTASYVFSDALPSAVQFVLQQFDILPRPAGVKIDILINPQDVFGFAPYYLNFNNGTFGA